MKRYIKAAKTIEDYENMDEFTPWGIRLIRVGLEEGLDVSWYADPKYTALQMVQIYKGLEAGVDVSWYADPKSNSTQMLLIREGLEQGLDVSKYADPKYDKDKMREIRESLKEKKLAKPQRNSGAYAKTIEDYVINGLPDSTGEEFDVVKYVEIVNDNPEYWELSGSDFHDTAFEMFEKDMEQKFLEMKSTMT